MSATLPQPMPDSIQTDAAQMLPSIERKLEDTRRRLLDLTRRNRLLNHRTTGRATLRIVDELPAEIFRLLVVEEHILQFLAREEAPKEAARHIESAAAADTGDISGQLGTSVDGPSRVPLSLAPIDTSNSTAARHSDKNLQTTLAGEPLQARLLYLAREAVSAREEQGCNILYLTLGIVEWSESNHDGVSRAPLLFIPVDLQRRTVRTRHSLTRYEDDILLNPCLIELCRRVFQFELPSVDLDENLDIDAYFAEVSAALAHLPGWKLLPEIHIGLFSFAKLLMYRDLDPNTWPAQAQLAAHPLIQRLSGFATNLPGDEQPMPAASQLDSSIPVNETYQVVDADSSQQVAIYAAKQGFSAVIEGPPGTGKSQTITNIIAECLATGKTVLFVAEKSAALAVVKRRLETIGIGDFVLELHSNKTGKRSVLDELQRTLTVYSEPFHNDTSDPSVLESSRSQLNSYVHDMHTPLSKLSISPYEAIERVLAVRNAPEPLCHIPNPHAWSAAQLHDALELLNSYDRSRSRLGDISRHPWRALRITALDTTTRQAIQHTLQALITALDQLAAALEYLASDLQCALPETVAAGLRLREQARQLLALPDLATGTIADERWEAYADGISAWIAQGRDRQARKAFWLAYANTEAEQVDWSDLRTRRQSHRDSVTHRLLPNGVEDTIMRWVSSRWQADTAQLEHYLKAEALSSLDLQLEVLDALLSSNALRQASLAGVPQYAELFRSHWHSIDADWEGLHDVFHAALSIRQQIRHGGLRREVAQRFLEQGARDTLSEHIAMLDQALAQAERSWQNWSNAIKCEVHEWLGGAQADTSPITALRHNHKQLVNSFDQLDDWVHYQRVRQECYSGALQSFIAWAEQPNYPQGQLAHSFARQFYQLWLDAAFLERPALSAFRGDNHERLIKGFCAADTSWIAHNRQRVAARIRERVPNLQLTTHRDSKLGILKGEIRKKRRHMALRKLFALTNDVLQTIKPCFMMSPISIAQYLAPGSITFDVVIFDEASQVEPADAYGAIARGRQLLLVGDEKQLPPTGFFSKIEVDDTPAQDDNLDAGDLESVLSLGVVRLRHQCSLRWHYRSRHASLIDFSNRQFYDSKLHVFPGPYADTSEFGLAFQFVEGGVYMRSAGQYNAIEAHAVAMAAIQHASERPHLSLGIGAFSVAQQRAIEDEIEQLRRYSADPRVESFFTAPTHEPFFVKNLETIQGDERDVILLSVGYGPDQNGKITMNFGPLNRDGGWRRLNVLVTRARQRCILFSSIHADQIDLNATRARGVAALKAYLQLAEQGGHQSTRPISDQRTVSIGALISQNLHSYGYEVHTNVGSVDSFINLAVVDPSQPGRYLLGIESDGDIYASAATARDRDRLRQQVLEDLGWQIQRVWSLDWYQRPELAQRRLLEQLSVARQQLTAGSAPGATIQLNTNALPENSVPASSQPSPPTTQLQNLAVSPPATRRLFESEPAQAANLSDDIPAYQASSLRSTTSIMALTQVAEATLARVVAKLVIDESPIHMEEVQRVIATYFGTRASKNARTSIDAAIKRALSEQLIRRRGAFLWTPTMISAPIRRHGDDCPVSKAELIAPEELQETIKLVLTREFGLKIETLLVSTSRALGYRRCGANLEAAIRHALHDLQTQEVVALDSAGFLKIQ